MGKDDGMGKGSRVVRIVRVVHTYYYPYHPPLLLLLPQYLLKYRVMW